MDDKPKNKVYFVTVTGTYLSNNQAYHACEKIVIAPTEELAIERGIDYTPLVETDRTHKGIVRSGDWDELTIYENPDDNNSELILDDCYAAEIASHLFAQILVAGSDGIIAGNHPKVQQAIALLESLAEEGQAA